MATIRDVAELAGVSLTTVSRILNKDDSMLATPEVKRRIFYAAHQLNYVTPRQKKLMRERRQLQIGIADWRIIRPDRPNIQVPLLEYTFQQLNDRYHVSFSRLVAGQPEQVDGIVAFGEFNEEELSFLRSLSPSIVLVNSHMRGYENDQVKIDFTMGLEELVRYLLLSRRYETIGYIGGTYESGNVRIGFHRADAFRKILKQYGKYDDRFFHMAQISMESGYELVKQAAGSRTLPRAVLVGSEEMAVGVFRALEEEKLRVPEDVAVIIYQDIKTLESPWDSTTCIEMYPDYVWENALEILIGRMENKRTQAITVIVPTHIKIGTTA